jgi:hypothetical protein
MSAISEEVRTALYTALNVSGVTTLATGGIHYKVAPQGTTGAIVVFDRLSSLAEYTFGVTLNMENDLWIVKAYADEDSDVTKSPPSLCQDILTAVEAALPATLTLASKTNRACVREGDISLPPETVNDREVFAEGFLLRVQSN